MQTFVAGSLTYPSLQIHLLTIQLPLQGGGDVSAQVASQYDPHAV